MWSRLNKIPVSDQNMRFICFPQVQIGTFDRFLCGIHNFYRSQDSFDHFTYQKFINRQYQAASPLRLINYIQQMQSRMSNQSMRIIYQSPYSMVNIHCLINVDILQVASTHYYFSKPQRGKEIKDLFFRYYFTSWYFDLVCKTHPMAYLYIILIA